MKKLTKEQAMKEAIEYFGDELSATVFINKYALNNNGVYYESTLDDSIERYVNAIIEFERNKYGINKRDEFILRNEYKTLFKHWLPAGRILHGLGNRFDPKSSMMNCYVLEISEDSLDGITDTINKVSKTFAKHGGVGFDLNLRPNGASISGTNIKSGGNVSFMPIFSELTNAIKQNGRSGALMMTMSINNPDIKEFIISKKDKTKINFANLSIRVTNEFMQKVVDLDKNPNAVWLTKYTDEKGRTFEREYKVAEIWDLFVEMNRQGGEPALLFWDEILTSPSSFFDEFRPISTNPCGEQALSNGDSCNLSAIDLSSFVIDPYTKTARFDFKSFVNTVHYAVRFMDSIIDINAGRHALDIQNEKALRGRRIGLGIMGLADMLIKMNLVYGSEKAIEFTDIVIKELKRETIKASVLLAEQRGMFPALKELKIKDYLKYKEFIDLPFFNGIPQIYKSKMLLHGIRNVGFNTVAPTGSTAMIKQVSSGIEPIFRFQYERTTLGEKYIVLHKTVMEYNEIHGENAHKNSEVFVESSDIYFENRIKMQQAVQKHLSESISSTVNLPSDTTNEIISELYKSAWRHGLKGITVYVDKSREGVLNEISDETVDKKIDRNTVDAKLKTIQYGKNKWYVTYTLGNNGLPNTLFVMTDAKETTETTNETIEVFGKLAIEYGLSQDELDEINKKYKNRSNTIRVVKSIRTLLEIGVPIIKIIETIDNMKTVNITSFVFQVKKLLAGFIDGTVTEEKCPECNEPLIMENGCKICKSCGYSKCD